MSEIRAKCSPEVQKAVDLMRGLGLRIKEALNVRVEHFVKEADGWKLRIEKGTGITKGGSFRYAPVPASFNGRLELLIQGKGQHERLVSVSLDTVRKRINYCVW